MKSIPYIAIKLLLNKDIMYKFYSSHGDLVTNDEGIVDIDESYFFDESDPTNYLKNIAKLDLEEFMKFIQDNDVELFDNETEFDIINVGFWKKDGTYEEPDHEWRNRVFDVVKKKLKKFLEP